MKTKVILFLSLFLFLFSFNSITAQKTTEKEIDLEAYDQLSSYFFKSNTGVIGLENNQLEQIRALEKQCSEAAFKVMEENPENYSASILRDCKTKGLKEMLTPEQIDIALSIARENLEERKNRKIERVMDTKNNLCPGLNMTFEQASKYYALEKNQDYEQTTRKDFQSMELELMEQVLTTEQFLRYKTTMESLQAQQAFSMEEEIRKELPVIQAYVALYVDNIMPKLQVLRARLEADIRASDKIQIDYFRTLIHEEIDREWERESGRNFSFGMINDEALQKDIHDMVFRAFEGLKKAPLLAPEMLKEEEFDDNTRTRIYKMADKYLPEMLKYEIELKALFDEILKGHEAIKKQFEEQNGSGSFGPPPPVYKASTENALKFLLTLPSDAEDASVNNSNVHKARAFPSPAKVNQTLEFNVPQSGNVQIDIVDANGQIQENVFSGTLATGTHQFQVNVKNLEGSVLYYRITSGSGSSVLKILLAK